MMAREATLTVLALALFISVLVIATEAKMKDKWRNKKSHHKSLSLSSDRSIINAMDEKKRNSYAPEFVANKLGGDSDEGLLYRRRWNKKRGKHGKRNKKARKAKFHRRGKAGKMGKQAPWSDFIRPENECEPKCERNEVCITGPVDGEPRCIHFKDLKRSMKQFRKYQKKEKKAWRKFHKKSKKYFQEKDVFDYGEERNFDDKAVKMGKLDMEKEYMRKRKEYQLMDGKRHDAVPSGALTPSEAGDPKACSTGDFSQMRNRIMGWFHLLRSHNKRAMKDERRLKAHRHSVKKQLDGGDKCQCMKSAMWEFHEMDEDEDDHLTDQEMSILEDNVMEPCMKPYLTSCDRDGNGLLSSAEWCCCFSNVLGPCYTRMDDMRRSGQPVTYMPRCDKEGYYMPEQCQRLGDDGQFECWCVDYNGNVAQGSKTDGRAHCKNFA